MHDEIAPGPTGAEQHAPQPPLAERRPLDIAAHGDRRTDDWAWLRDRDDPAVLAHLRAEQAYTEAVLAPTRPLQDRLFDEIRSRIVETDLSVPVAKDAWWYYQRTVKGLDYPLHCRVPRHGGADRDTPPVLVATAAGEPGPSGEQVLLDENALAAGSPYLALGDLAVSPGHGRLAYSTDTTGDERYTLRFHSLPEPGAAIGGTTGTGPGGNPGAGGSEPADPPEVIEGTSYGVAWADDDTVFYTRPDDANRPFQLWRHVVATDPSTDVLVHQEDDERFHLGVSRTKDGAYVLLELHSKVTSEVRALRCDDPCGPCTVVVPRRPGVECTVEHHTGTFLVLTNDGAENFRVMALPAARVPASPVVGTASPVGTASSGSTVGTSAAGPGGDGGGAPLAWHQVVPERPGSRIDGLDVLAGHVVLHERVDGSARIRVLPLPPGPDPFASPLDEGWLVPCPDTPSTSWAGPNPEFASTVLRYEYSSLVAPRSVYDLDLATGQAVLRKQQQVLGGYDPAAYVSTRLWADAPDGTRIPVSVVRRSETPVDGTAPCLLYGYGAYEHSIDPVFSSIRLSLLDRGVVFAIAHVRGGGELGRRWYEQGKLAAKPNSFSDFVACADMLATSGWADGSRLVARGGSAGGLLVGAAMNLAPDRFRAVVAEVPFVDCLTTMLDDTLPLTVIERDEWGDPEADPGIYDAMRAYSPYDNVRDVRYPDVLATAGLEDPRVGFWEPAKWVQRLRAAHPDNRVLLHVELGAGHGGPTGRYDAWRDEARVIAFVLTAVGISS